jgi:hypothetical protein
VAADMYLPLSLLLCSTRRLLHKLQAVAVSRDERGEISMLGGEMNDTVMQMIFHCASVPLSFPNVHAAYGVLFSRYDTAFIIHELQLGPETQFVRV